MLSFSILSTLLFVVSSIRASPVSPSKTHSHPSHSGTSRSYGKASTFAGASTSDVYVPPAATNSAYFPNESQVGYAGATPTGAEPFAGETGIAFPRHTDIYPLVVPRPLKPAHHTSSRKSEFIMQHNFGNYAPAYSVDSAVYGLKGATPLAPKGHEITQVHYFYRHGARYPTSGEPAEQFAAKIQAAAISAQGFAATGPLSFLNTWTYKLGEATLTVFGRKQNFDLGATARILYGRLLDGFTALPVFRAQSGDRMVKTALNFAAGFFGIPYENQFELIISVEAPGFNNTGAPYFSCPNTNQVIGSQGKIAQGVYAAKVFESTAARLSKDLRGINVTTSDVVAMIELCAYETGALGYSSFCSLFTENEFEDFEYFLDLGFYYNFGFGSPTGAANGLGYLQELYSRLTQTPIPKYDSTTNSTLDGNSVTFPLDQPFYADATHEVTVLALITALNLTSIAASGALPLTHRPKHQTFIASRVVPFATTLVIQVLTESKGTKMIRFIVNDAVLPLTYKGCAPNPHGLCAFDTVIAALGKRINEIDFQHDCFGNYTATVGVDLNGRAPRS